MRSNDHPDGLPDLKEKDKQRVAAANASYQAMIAIAKFAIALGISISLENQKFTVLEMLICFAIFGMVAVVSHM